MKIRKGKSFGEIFQECWKKYKQAKFASFDDDKIKTILQFFNFVTEGGLNALRTVEGTWSDNGDKLGPLS